MLCWNTWECPCSSSSILSNSVNFYSGIAKIACIDLDWNILWPFKSWPRIIFVREYSRQRIDWRVRANKNHHSHKLWWFLFFIFYKKWSKIGTIHSKIFFNKNHYPFQEPHCNIKKWFLKKWIFSKGKGILSRQKRFYL